MCADQRPHSLCCIFHYRYFRRYKAGVIVLALLSFFLIIAVGVVVVRPRVGHATVGLPLSMTSSTVNPVQARPGPTHVDP